MKFTHFLPQSTNVILCNTPSLAVSRTSPSQMFFKIGFLKIFANFTKNFASCNFIKKKFQHRCFPGNFAKLLRTPFLQNTSGGCFCMSQVNKFICFLSAKKFLRRHYRTLRIFTGKKHPQIKFQCFWKLWIWTCGYLLHQVKSLYEVFKLKQNFRKNKVVNGKTPFFVIDPFCTLHPTLASDRAVLSGNVVFSFLVLTINKRYSSFLRKVCVIQKICFKAKVLKTFQISSDCHIKT